MFALMSSKSSDIVCRAADEVHFFAKILPVQHRRIKCERTVGVHDTHMRLRVRRV